MPMEFDLVPAGMRVEASGEGQPVDITGSQTRTFLCTLEITEVVEQESLDISIWGSEDGENWGQKPLLKLPQRFYGGQTRMVLDLTLRPEVRFVKARWEVNRWGRVAPLPMFVFGLRAAEVPAFPKRAPADKVAAGN